MALKESEAIVLRSYPLRESDLLVTFFTRAEGKVKGVAKAAKKSRKRFGGALELVTTVRLFWEDRERQELARIDSCEVVDSPLSEPVGYRRLAARAFWRCSASCCSRMTCPRSTGSASAFSKVSSGATRTGLLCRPSRGESRRRPRDAMPVSRRWAGSPIRKLGRRSPR